MQQTIRLLLLSEAVCFIVAGGIHSGLLIAVAIHLQAAIAESAIGVGLLVGFGLSWAWPGSVHLISLTAQTFALFGTLVGAFTIAVGVGPRSVPDIAFHIAMLVVLALGLVITARSRNQSSVQA